MRGEGGRGGCSLYLWIMGYAAFSSRTHGPAGRLLSAPFGDRLAAAALPHQAREASPSGVCVYGLRCRISATVAVAWTP